MLSIGSVGRIQVKFYLKNLYASLMQLKISMPNVAQFIEASAYYLHSIFVDSITWPLIFYIPYQLHAIINTINSDSGIDLLMLCVRVNNDTRTNTDWCPVKSSQAEYTRPLGDIYISCVL